MSLFKLGKDSFVKVNNSITVKNLSLLTASILCFNMLMSSDGYMDVEKEMMISKQIEEENIQMNEIYNQIGDINDKDEQLHEEAEEEKRIREENIQKEAEEILEYYEEAQEIVDQTVYIDKPLNYEDTRRDYCENNYGEAIEEIAPRFGISPNIIRAIATQEGGGIKENVMQVASGWRFKKISYHDYILDKDMRLCIYSGENKIENDILYISTSDPNWSVYLGSCLFQVGLEYNNGHVFSAFTHYNRGDATPLVNKVANHEGISRTEYLEDKYNAAIQYYEYNKYILYCLQFMDENPMEYTYFDKDTNDYEHVVIYPEYENRDINEIIQYNLGDEPLCEYSENEELLDNASRQLACAISEREIKGRR